MWTIESLASMIEWPVWTIESLASTMFARVDDGVEVSRSVDDKSGQSR
jgi:hypothetical protein